MLLSFEGIDGSGKTTIINHLVEKLKQQSLSVKVLQEPGTSKMGQQIRKLLKTSTPRTSLSELLLYEASRADMVETVLIPSLKKYDVVILDRYIDSTIAYQGYGNKNDIELIDVLNNIATKGILPDISFFIDVNVDEAKQRRLNRNESHNDMLDTDDQYANDVYNGYKKLNHLVSIKNDDLYTAVQNILAVIEEYTVLQSILESILENIDERTDK